MDLLCFCSVLCLLCLCARLFIFALWSPVGKGLTSWLSFVVSAVSLSLSHLTLGQVWYLIVSIPDLCTLTYFKSLLRQGLSEPEFYGDLVYKLKKIVGSNNFSAQFIKIISHYKKIGYNINVLQQTACLVVNPIMVCNFAFLFN